MFSQFDAIGNSSPEKKQALQLAVAEKAVQMIRKNHPDLRCQTKVEKGLVGLEFSTSMFATTTAQGKHDRIAVKARQKLEGQLNTVVGTVLDNARVYMNETPFSELGPKTGTVGIEDGRHDDGQLHLSFFIPAFELIWLIAHSHELGQIKSYLQSLIPQGMDCHWEFLQLRPEENRFPPAMFVLKPNNVAEYSAMKEKLGKAGLSFSILKKCDADIFIVGANTQNYAFGLEVLSDKFAKYQENQIFCALALAAVILEISKASNVSNVSATSNFFAPASSTTSECAVQRIPTPEREAMLEATGREIPITVIDNARAKASEESDIRNDATNPRVFKSDTFGDVTIEDSYSSDEERSPVLGRR